MNDFNKMKIFNLCYNPNFYSNGAKWTHIIKVWQEENPENEPIKLEEDKAINVKDKLRPYLSGNSLDGLLNAMRERKSFECQLLLSEHRSILMKSNAEMQTYTYRLGIWGR